jgi:hypothetical protein
MWPYLGGNLGGVLGGNLGGVLGGGSSSNNSNNSRRCWDNTIRWNEVSLLDGMKSASLLIRHNNNVPQIPTKVKNLVCRWRPSPSIPTKTYTLCCSCKYHCWWLQSLMSWSLSKWGFCLRYDVQSFAKGETDNPLTRFETLASIIPDVAWAWWFLTGIAIMTGFTANGRYSYASRLGSVVSSQSNHGEDSMQNQWHTPEICRHE